MSGFTLDDSLIAELGWQQPRSAIQAVGNPAAGGGFTLAMPGTEDTRVDAVSFRVVADANAATRTIVFRYLDQDGNVMFPVAAPYTQTTGVTVDYTFGIGLQQAGANNAAVIVAPLPNLKLYVGLSVEVGITNVQAGDQVSRIRLALAQWPVRP